MSFEIELDPKSSAAVDFMTMVHRELVRNAIKSKLETGLTQRQVAEMLNIDKSSISRILAGRGNPTLRTVGELLWAFGVENSQLVTQRRAVSTNVAAPSAAPSTSVVAIFEPSKCGFEYPNQSQTGTSGHSATLELVPAQ